MTTSLEGGWGYVIETRCKNGQNCQAFIQFANEEAPRWITYAELQRHRRTLLDSKATQPLSG